MLRKLRNLIQSALWVVMNVVLDTIVCYPAHKSFLMFGLLLVIATLELGVYAETIQLFPKYVNVEENASVTLKCSKQNGQLVETSWTNSQIQGKIARIYYNGETCFTTEFLKDNNLFDGICNGDGTYSVLLKTVDRTQFGAVWQCAEALQYSNEVTIKELVPVASVDIYSPTETYMKENHSQTIRCKSSACRPQPTIAWFLRNPIDHTEHNITENTTQISSENEDKLVVLEGSLHILPDRSLNGWALMCKAWNNIQSHAVISKEVVLNISYPPDNGPKIHGYGPGKPLQIIESDHGEFSCSITGGNPLATLSWNCFNSESATVQVMNRSVVSNITWTAVRNQSVCSCVSYHIYKGKQAAQVNVDVLYPPTMPFFTINSTNVLDVVNIIQNNTLQISCKSISNPTPRYTWSGPNSSNRLEQSLNFTVTHMYEGKYTCTAENKMVRSDSTSEDGKNTSDISVKMLYPPTKIHCRYGNKDGELISENLLYVIKGDSFSIYCDADGYPSPVFKWDNYTDGHSLNITSIRSDAKKTCIAINWMNETVGESRFGSNSAIFSISVLYPPSIPTIRVSNGNTNEITDTAIISIIETDTIEISCYSKSKPRPRYTWFRNKLKLTEHRNVTLANISRVDAGNYTCLVNNIMNRTFGKSEARTITSSTLLNVLYAPDVGTLTNINLIEKSTLNITCPIIRGNPLNTTVFWSRKKDDRRWNNKQLIILNVSRTDDTVYTCTVLNKMIPTFGSVIEKKGSGEFHLNIFFSAKISNFSVSGKEYKGITVVNETEEVPLRCTAEANPASNITIKSPKQEVIAMVSNKNVVYHTLHNVSYVNAGQYDCTGRNNYTNDKTPSSKLILIVRCPPRPSSDTNNDENVTTILNADVTLQFTAHDFLDEPDKTVFMWFKDNAAVESHASKFFISTIGLQSNLSVSNVTERDFGQYRVRVTNTVGNYTHNYELQAKDKPDVPKDFSYIKDSINDSSVTVHWVPGFNGGYPQNFIVLYKRTTESNWQNKSIEDTGDRHMDYTLFGLLSKSEYQVKMFARNEEGDSPYTNELQFSTKAPIAQPIESVSSDNAGIVAGSVSCAIIVSAACIIVGIYIYRRRNIKGTGNVYQNVAFSGKHFNTAATSKRNHTTTKTRKGETVHTEETAFEDLHKVDDIPIITNERTENCNSPEIIERIDRIHVSELFSYVSETSEDLFEADFQKLPTELQKPCTCARKPENIALNRYKGLYPYDHSRVKLYGIPDFYINACYIDGYKDSKSYIASLGPTSETTSHFKTFWQMIWYERSDIIVMLTNLREPSGMKCEQYWPKEGKAEQYGDVCVSSQTAEVFAEYTVRTFSVSSEGERRSLTHLHYTAWPDKTVPEDVTSLIEFRQRMKSTPTSSEGPIVIHCSAGIGRTGTLIALNRLIEEGQDKGSVDVFDCVNNMRKQRVKMVQTYEQYIYIHKALVNALTFDCEALPVETFNEYVDTTNNNTYSWLFQQLRQTVETDSKAEANDRSKNGNRTDKNRRGADIPGFRFRVLLYLDRRGEGSEYINAVYINSFKRKDRFITAQSPLPNTVTDFIAMIYQEKCSCIATMEHLMEPEMKVGQYLPDGNHTLTLGNFKVSCSVLETKPHFVVRKMKIKYAGQFESGEKSVYHFKFTKWMPGHDTPTNAEEFLQFVNEVGEYANELGEERSPVLVHCLRANERSGLFCAVSILMEKIKFERQVSVSNTLRHLRTRRQTAIISMEQLKFCYQATSAYIKNTLK